MLSSTKNLRQIIGFIYLRLIFIWYTFLLAPIVNPLIIVFQIDYTIIAHEERPANVRVTSEPPLGAEFAQTSEAGRKLRDTRRVCLKWLLGESLQNYYSI